MCIPAAKLVSRCSGSEPHAARSWQARSPWSRCRRAPSALCHRRAQSAPRCRRDAPQFASWRFCTPEAYSPPAMRTGSPGRQNRCSTVENTELVLWRKSPCTPVRRAHFYQEWTAGDAAVKLGRKQDKQQLGCADSECKQRRWLKWPTWLWI